MSDKTHSPGPWHTPDTWFRYGNDPEDDFYVTVRGGAHLTEEGEEEEETVCTVCHNDLESAQANARLIAAAPDLLEALEWCLNAMNHAYGGADNFAAMEKDKARAAITKATGGDSP